MKKATESAARNSKKSAISQVQTGGHTRQPLRSETSVKLASAIDLECAVNSASALLFSTTERFAETIREYNCYTDSYHQSGMMIIASMVVDELQSEFEKTFHEMARLREIERAYLALAVTDARAAVRREGGAL
jgi:hypothetical protein